MRDDVLIDAGPLVALVDRSDEWHSLCRRTFEDLDASLTTVWPAVTEASHLLKHVERGQDNLLRLVESEAFRLARLDRDDVLRIRELMLKYHDLPMDLADAALVRVAERDQIRQVFTLDRRDFEVYRPARIARFRILP
jgi:predicted nucleic acid-binding protein